MGERITQKRGVGKGGWGSLDSFKVIRAMELGLFTF